MRPDRQVEDLCVGWQWNASWRTVRQHPRKIRHAPRDPVLGCESRTRVTLTQMPRHEATHWTSAMMAQVVRNQRRSCATHWRAHGLQPHRVNTVQTLPRPRFVDQLRDVVGSLSIRPPMPSSSRSMTEQIRRSTAPAWLGQLKEGPRRADDHD